MLYPKDTLTRETKDLSGMWQFKADFDHCGRREKWQASPLARPDNMPVPASYNDITVDPHLRDHIGEVWYETTFYVPQAWQKQIVSIRFGAVSHHTTAWINGQQVVENKGGFLPFEAQINEYLNEHGPNRLTVAVDNTLDHTTLPPGEVKKVTHNGGDNGTRVYGAQLDTSVLPVGYQSQDYYHDFFNYGGIHRPVWLVARNPTYLEDITVRTDRAANGDGIVHYDLDIVGDYHTVALSLRDEDGNIVASADKTAGRLTVTNPTLWRPLQADLYELDVRVFGPNEQLLDHYFQTVGIRTVKIEGDRFLINGEPFYFKGFGKHEDMDIKGKGLDHAVNARDLNLMTWINANSFRTSHYPYAEETLDLADRLGFVVIDESPAVGLRFLKGDDEFFAADRDLAPLLDHHLQTMRQLIQRDKNHPCVVMWSVANEPASFEDGAVDYFTKVVEHTRELDPHRPVTIVSCSKPEDCKVSHLVDVLCVNYYFSWYTTPGRLDVLQHQLEQTLRKWYERYPKPLIMAEYGADTVAGLHTLPASMFTEEYQCELLDLNQQVFDRLDFVIGEHVWNFADFATKQEFTRVVGNRKGVFTRQRQPKAAAHLLRNRWASI